MNDKYLNMALEKIPDKNTLVLVASRRARQLAGQAKPMTKPESSEDTNLDIALKEIGEGLLTYYYVPLDEQEDD